MDEEEVNNGLSKRIRQVFDNYEDTTADEGWALLRQKFPQEKKDRGLAWLWYAAAALVLITLGVWFIYQPVDNKNLVVKNPKINTQPNHKNNTPNTVDTMVKQAVNNMAQVKVQPSVTPATLQNGSSPQLAQTHITPIQKTQQALQVARVTNKQVQNNATNNMATVNMPTIAPVKKPGTDSILNKKVLVEAIAQNQPDTKSPVKPVDSAAKNTAQYASITKPVDVIKPSSAEALNKLLAEKMSNKSDQQNKTAKKTALSVYAATYFNYAQGSENNINVGAGFSSDFRISNKLKFSTGLAIAQNSLKYNNGQPVRSEGSLKAAADPAGVALNQVANSAYTAPGAFVALNPVLKNYNASLIGLDIPINLKYQFNPQKSDTYISAGLSSGTFINETYILNYTYGKNEQQNTTHSSFSGFDFAKTLNVSFGIGYPLGKSNRLIVEPFLKYPLDGLGSQQIKFGAGGINLKLNFQSGKK